MKTRYAIMFNVSGIEIIIGGLKGNDKTKRGRSAIIKQGKSMLDKKDRNRAIAERMWRVES